VWELVESGSGRRFPLKEGATTIGRENGDILLLDGTISRRHARIEMSGGTITVVDEGSTNGSQVDGIRLAPNQGVKAAPGAAIRFGSVTLTLVAPDAAAPAPLGSSDVTIAVEVGAAPMAVAEPAAEESVVPTGAAVDPSEPPSAHLKPTTENAEPILIRTGRTTLGRRAGNDVILAGDPFISGSHAEITCDYNGCYLTDVGSTNGTVVNGQKLEAGMPQLLLDGDTVVLGQATYTFATLEQPEEDEEEADEATAEAEPAVEANDIPVATGEEDSAEAPKA
jgi:pSer/pThr/pTyr-binding forkhead associated (FHA) protein